ncbi:MAG: GNAT family N-acetyltransferase [Pseudohongiella sp.]|nr:GNAT family N-acetyltransferase [Pseudohongiella sp.]
MISSLWQVDDAKPEHQQQIRELFKSVFKKDMSRSNWEWKYGDGRGAGVIVRTGDEVVAYFGGTERRVLFKGEAVCSIQCGDSMVAQSHRGTLSKKGPFYLSVTAFLDRYVGFERPYLLSYGFPNERAMRLAERLGMYAEVGTMADIAWSAESSAQFESVVFDFESAAHQDAVKQLWSAMAADFADRSIGIRDLDYLRHRYHDHPALNYQLHLVSHKNSSTPFGLLVTRQIDDRLLLVDMVSAKNNIRDLASFGRHLASELNCQDLYGWLTEVDCPLIADTSVIIGEKPLRLPLGVYCEGLQASEVKDSWFFMCGDSDFL